jgi:hypothetical protein
MEHEYVILKDRRSSAGGGSGECKPGEDDSSDVFFSSRASPLRC